MCAKLLKSHRERSYSIRCARLGANILNFGMEMAMSNNHLNYLRREHARLDAELQREERQVRPDEVLIARLTKLKLAVKDQMEAECVDLPDSRIGGGIGGGGGGQPQAERKERSTETLFRENINRTRGG